MSEVRACMKLRYVVMWEVQGDMPPSQETLALVPTEDGRSLRWKRSPGGKEWGRYDRKAPGEHPERWLSVKDVAKVYQGCQVFLCHLLGAEQDARDVPVVNQIAG